MSAVPAPKPVFLRGARAQKGRETMPGRFARRTKGFRAARFLAAVLMAALAAGPGGAASRHDEQRGEAFTDPQKTVPMTKEWAAKPIAYEKTTGRADIVISLEQDVYQTIMPLIDAYAKKTGLKIVTQEGTCGIAAGALARKTVDIGGFCCPPGMEDRFPGLRYHTLGIVGLAFFVHPENPVGDLLTEDLRDLYRGRMHRWSELKTADGRSGPDRTITAIGRLHCQLRPGHWRQLLDNEKLFSPRMQEVGTIPDMIARVAGQRDAVGWEVLSMVDKYKSKGRVKILSVDGHRPDDHEAIRDLRYPFYRTYNITTWEGAGIGNRKARELVDYLTRETEKLDPARFGFVSASRLRKAGWRFSGDELIGEPR